MVEQTVKRETITLQAVGGPTAVITYAGLRFLTDPTFDAPREYERSTGATLVKLAGPALGPDEVEPIDAVLLSHDHHEDNLDHGGRAFLARAGRVVTTRAGAERLPDGATGLDPFESVELERPDGGTVRITATPAEHGPPEFAERNGPVIGFYLQADGWPALYVSGDNASVDVVRTIVDRLGPADVAVLFAGAAQVPGKPGDLTLTAERAVEATLALNARAAIPIHQNGWRHFTQNADDVRRAFAAAGLTDRLVDVEPGQTVTAS
jgi:L-ascorbate metabolism protein UlaG (beta-lactamase superfamily)